MKPEDDELDADLKRVLSHDPGEGYFRDFASRVTDRIAADARAEAARAEAARTPWWRGLLSSPRALAAVGGVAVVAVAAGIAFNVMRHPADALRTAGLRGRAPAEAEAPAAGAVARETSPGTPALFAGRAARGRDAGPGVGCPRRRGAHDHGCWTRRTGAHAGGARRRVGRRRAGAERARTSACANA